MGIKNMERFYKDSRSRMERDAAEWSVIMRDYVALHYV